MEGRKTAGVAALVVVLVGLSVRAYTPEPAGLRFVATSDAAQPYALLLNKKIVPRWDGFQEINGVFKVSLDDRCFNPCYERTDRTIHLPDRWAQPPKKIKVVLFHEAFHIYDHEALTVEERRDHFRNFFGVEPDPFPICCPTNVEANVGWYRGDYMNQGVEMFARLGSHVFGFEKHRKYRFITDEMGARFVGLLSPLPSF